jgi:hypothetical protein
MTRVGSVGTFTGVAVAGALGALSPTALIATTRTDTGVPFDRPAITTDVEVPETVAAVDHVAPPLDCSTRYMAMTPPPFDDGAVQETDSWLSPGVRVTPVATDGTVAGETETDAVVTLEPTAFSADTRNW